MNLLGLGGTGHSFSACLFLNGEIRYAVEEERLNGVKHSILPDTSFELARCRAGEYCLKAAGLNYDQIDLVVTSDIINKLYYARYVNKTILIPHHLSHACSVYFTSPFEEAAILILDGCGSAMGSRGVSKPNETESISYYYGEGIHLRDIYKISGTMLSNLFPYNSVGEFYYSVTKAIGFKFLDEGKTMGLAPYGTNKYVLEFFNFYKISESGHFSRNKRQVIAMQRFLENILIQISSEEEKKQMFADLAYAAQYHLENILVQACKALYKKTKSKNLCLAGGVVFNSAANYKILNETAFENIYIFPQAGDAGTAIGSALYGYHVLKNKQREPFNMPFSPYLGRNITVREYQETIAAYYDRIEIISTDNFMVDVAKLLSQGKIIGWFNGRSEIGPRSLGNRSILADPRNPQMKDIINTRIKHREAFRPFAPIVLEERQHEYFTMTESSYYMLMVAPVREDKREQIPAVTHVDGTGRMQTVSQKLNLPLYELLSAFDAITGTPVLLNTSFNDNGQPIVETPEDAMKTFLRIDLDYLIMNNMIIRKNIKNR